MKCLITGGAGFIGSHLADELLNSGYEVVVIDDFSTGKEENLSQAKNCSVYTGDINDSATLLKIRQDHCDIRIVFHLAAVASVHKSFEFPLKTHDVNFRGTLNLIEAFKNSSVKKIVYASSAAVYGDSCEVPISENSPVCPKSPYGADKLAGEYYLSFLANKYEFEYVCCRFFNVYGPRQDPSSPYSGVISIFTNRIRQKLLGKEVEIEIFGDGMQSRDFIYVKDVVATLKIIGNSKCKNSVYNIGTGNATTLLTLVESLKKISSCDIKVIFKPQRKGDIKESCSDNTAVLNEFKTDFTSLETGLSNLL